MKKIELNKVEIMYEFLMKDEKFASFVKELKQMAFFHNQGFGNEIKALCVKTIPAKWGKSDTSFTENKEYIFKDYSKTENCEYYSYSTNDNDCMGAYRIDFFNQNFVIIDNLLEVL